MPVQKKNNAQKQHNETEEMYSHPIDLNNSDTSTSPPLYIPPPTFRPVKHPPYYNDDGSELEAMTSADHQVEYAKIDPPIVSPTATEHFQPPPVSTQPRLQGGREDTHTFSHAGHVRSPILAR
jgi:hypothetical protein